VHSSRNHHSFIQYFSGFFPCGRIFIIEKLREAGMGNNSSSHRNTRQQSTRRAMPCTRIQDNYTSLAALKNGMGKSLLLFLLFYCILRTTKILTMTDLRRKGLESSNLILGIDCMLYV